MTTNLAKLSAQMRRGEQITYKDTAKVALSLSIPSILSQLVITLMQYIDAAMVGHLGANATASIGIVASTTWLFNGLMTGLSTAFAVQVAQYLGAHREQDARDVFRQGILLNVIFGVTLSIVGVALSFHLPTLLGAEQVIRADSSAYFMVWSIAIPLQLGMNLYASMLRCCGDARTPSILTAIMCPLDIIFNFFLINSTREISVFGFTFTVWGAGLGVMGAAIGTAAATGIACVLMLRMLLVRPGVLQYRLGGSWRITKTCLYNIYKIGLPLSAERMALSSAQVAMISIVASLGTVSIAANSLAVNAEALCYLPGYGVQAACIALVGQAIGANRKDMAKRFAWLCTAAGGLLMGLCAVLLYIFAPALMGIFTPDGEVIAKGVEILRIVAFAEAFFGLSIVASGALQGAGDSKICFILNVISIWGVRIPLCAYLAPIYGLRGVWIAMSLELTLRGIIFVIRLAQGSWLKKKALQ